MFKRILLSTLFISIFLSCLNAKEFENGKVLDIKNAGGYIYLQVKTEKEILWAAVPGTDIKIGDKVKIEVQLRTKEYTSKSLNYTFKNVIFGVIKNKNDSSNYKRITKEQFIKAHKKKDVTYNENGVKTNINELLKNPKKYKTQLVEIEGKVTKISSNIMNTNWIHLQDKKGNDLIIRTSEDRLYVGQEVKTKGIILTDVDYGYNYKYKVILVDAVFKAL
ncbi:MAG: hypothetical protein HRT40_07650 [Campylobacteraceae bacterium]|nr:hypothetical protein [Campylobacteraceae bacterium]